MRLQLNMITIISLMLLLLQQSIAQEARYYPPLNEWDKASPSSQGANESLLDEAITYAIEHESSKPRNMEVAHYMGFGKEPFGYAIGPLKERGEPTGIIIKNGKIIASWGEPERVDMTHSVSKTFLSSLVGVAYDRGMIKDVHDLVGPYMAPISFYNPLPTYNKADGFHQNDLFEPFASEHNGKITWDHLLRQTSNWEGTLWGKPDWADRPDKDPTQWLNAERPEPGTVYEYNDTRVNLLALAIQNIWRKPLPQVLKEVVMDKIDASPSWRWHGYENSWILLDGAPVQVVSGGGHWGGGMFINAYDQARLGYLTMNRGQWNGEQILSDEWVTMAMTPGVSKTYGFMNWFLNTEQELIKTAPESAFAHFGAGTNMVYVDPVQNLVAVVRWIDRKSIDGFVEKLLASFK